MRIAVKDASILIDLAEGDLLGLWFRLEIETHTTDLVLQEVKQETQWRRVSPFVDAKLLQIHQTRRRRDGRSRRFLPSRRHQPARKLRPLQLTCRLEQLLVIIARQRTVHQFEKLLLCQPHLARHLR